MAGARWRAGRVAGMVAVGALSLNLGLLAGCGGTTEETDTAVAVGSADGGVPTEPVDGTGGSVVEAPETPAAPPTIGVGTEAAPDIAPPADGETSP